MKFIVSTYYSKKCLRCYPLAHWCISKLYRGLHLSYHIQIELESSYRALQMGQRVSSSSSLIVQDCSLSVIVSTASTLGFSSPFILLSCSDFFSFLFCFSSLLFLFFSLLFLSCLFLLFTLTFASSLPPKAFSLPPLLLVARRLSPL